MKKLPIYLLIALIGFTIIYLISTIRNVPPTRSEEYYYSTLLQNGYTYLTGVVLLLAAIPLGFYWKLNPWVAGLSMIIVFPITSIVESIIYPGSHNLIPFEFLAHFVFSLPAIIGFFTGKFLQNRKNARPVKKEA